ncbi:hypothetical protein [Cellulomonas hominis]
MTWSLVIVLVVPAVAFVLAFVVAFPDDRRATPRWRAHLAEHLEHAAQHLRHRAPVTPDPFRALQVQSRLAAVSEHVQALEADRKILHRAERIIASQLAYDDLLAEACQLAGIDVPRPAKGDPHERFREEMELAEHGWSW